ncbi:hypothetical protein PSHT_09367 [Puccinia striiformis]|uniref:Uncharacterized protein n=3 Tax=Puccinia striiformis TaxID=27350 RepID=A0A0L0V0U4_9BASI|nr:hypothetical protein PSTG_13687 [Puccinia striiformis f. sp. tritici PST-78]POW08942.1 hypothetical protein PSHT_09367 [Puccinia striiformis]
MFKVNQLLAMRMSWKAWDSVSASTIANCCGVTKIIKKSPDSCLEVINKGIENSTAALESQLNTLEFIGAVLPQNHMSISNLLDRKAKTTTPFKCVQMKRFLPWYKMTMTRKTW